MGANIQRLFYYARNFLLFFRNSQPIDEVSYLYTNLHYTFSLAFCLLLICSSTILSVSTV